MDAAVDAGPPVRARVPRRARGRDGALGARARSARARAGRAQLAGRRHLRHHRAPAGRGGPARAGGRAGTHGGAARLASPHRPRRRLRAPAHPARPARRRPAAAGDAGAPAARRARARSTTIRPPPAASSTRRSTSWGMRSTDLRSLARGIHPAVLSDRGLEAALQSLAARAPLPVELEVHGEPAAGGGGVGRVLRGGRGADERREVRRGDLRVGSRRRAEDAHVLLEVADDGIGGALGTSSPASAGSSTGSRRSTGGWRSSARRAEGTIVRARIPVDVDRPPPSDHPPAEEAAPVARPA